MNGFIRSFNPLLKKSKKYLLEIILLTVALIIIITALAIYAKNNQSSEEEIETSSTSPTALTSLTSPAKIFVDVSGAVKKPDVYQVMFGARLKDVIDKAGGLSDEADTVFFNRNFNLARIVTDQEKIYVPSTVEINNGIFVQNQRTLDYTTPGISPNTGVINNAPTNNNININSATIEELDQLPGIGKITADKIIKNRPYSTIEELLTKKAVNKSVFGKIKSLISIN